MMKILWTALAFVWMTNVAAQEVRNLMVEVRIEGQSTEDVQGVGVGIGARPSGWGLQAGQRTVRRTQNNIQRLLVMDGGTAVLGSVQTQPIRLRQVLLSPYGKIISDGYVFRSLGGGVQVRPQSRGERVVIEVSAEDAQPVPGQAMATQTLQLSTQISGQMGEWILLGDDERSSGRDGNHIGLDGVAQGSSGSSGSQRVWLRVNPQ